MHLRFRKARRLAKLSQSELAQLVGVRRSAVSQWEAPGGKRPGMANLCAVAVANNVRLEWLATGRGPMTLTEDERLDAIVAVDGLMLDDPDEVSLIRIFRRLPNKAQILIMELAELAGSRSR